MSNRAVGVVGGGLMGAGIATKFALAGHEVLILETSAERRATIPAVITDVLQELIAAGIVDAAGGAAARERVKLVETLPALAAAPVIIEAIPEVLAAKQELYRQLEVALAPGTVIASNTSGLMPDVLCANLEHPERFLITHFWNPPHAIPLVEVVPGVRTDPSVVNHVMAVLRDIGSEPVLLRKAVPGFIGNRIQFAILREALHLVRSGVADAATIDAVVKASLGRRYAIMGPFEAADLGGLETFLRVAMNLLPALARDESGLDELRERISRGETGAATGQGFYPWTDQRRDAIRQERIAFQLRVRPESR